MEPELAVREANADGVRGIILGMTARVRPFMLLFVPLVAASPGANSAAAPDGTPQVIVVKKGFVGGDAESSYAEYGVVLRNRSTRDALNISLRVKGLDSRGRVFTSNDTYVTVVPARTNFVIAGALVWGVSVKLAAIKPTVRVGKMALRGRRLPITRNVRLGPLRDEILGSLTNPYRKPLPRSTEIYGLFLDGKGRIVAVGDPLMTGAVVQPRQTVPFDISGTFASTAQIGAIRSVRVSVDPCGDGFFGGTCPIAGASPGG